MHHKIRTLLRVAIGVAIVVVVGLIVSFVTQRYLYQQAEIRIRDVLLEAKSLHQYVQEDMHPEMYQLKAQGRMPQNFYSPEILSSSYITRNVFKHFNEHRKDQGLPLVEYKMAANNPRNKVNQADDFQAELISLFNNDRSIDHFSKVYQENGAKYMLYARPFLVVENRCLRCHGPYEDAPTELRSIYQWESGFNWVLGDIPAVEIIRTPIVLEMQASYVVLIAVLIVSFTFLLLVLVLSRLKRDNIKKTQDKDYIQQRYYKLFDNSGDIIIILDEHGVILDINSMGLKISGFEKDELVGKNLSEFYDDANAIKVKHKIAYILHNQKSLYEAGLIKKDGTRMPAEVNASLFPYNGSNAILLSIRDITIRKKQENELLVYQNSLEQKVDERTSDLNRTLEQLKEAQSQLVQNEKMASLGVLTAGVAHEINNPLNYIMGAYVGLEDYFQHNIPEDAKTIEILLRGMKSGVDKASDIVKGLNQFSRDSKTYDEKCNIHEIIDNCLAMLLNNIKYKAEIVKEYDTIAPCIHGNSGELHQVFLNILANALQAIVEEGKIIIKTCYKDTSLIIDVIDDGVGISEDNLSRISDPFFTTKEPGEGTGLGLSISYKIIQNHKGSVAFESTLGMGTKCTITLPVIKDHNI